jgi:predicted nucleic acid-binding protein
MPSTSSALGGAMLVDSSGVLAALDAGEPDHEDVLAAIEADERPLRITDFVIAEVDFLILKRLGPAAEQRFLEQINEGIFRRETVTDDDVLRATEIIEQFEEHRFGITDATIMALSERLGISEVLTLDARHFTVFRDRRGKALTILP